MISWQTLILISVILYSVSVLLQKIILKEGGSHPTAFSVFFQVLTGCFIGLFGLLTSDMSLPDLKPYAFNLILMVGLYGFSNVFIFRSLKEVEASKFSVIFSTRTFFTILASSFLMGDFLSLRQVFGVVLVFAGVLLVSLKKMRLNFGKAEALALVGAICFGFAVTNDRFLLSHLNLYPYVTMSFVVTGGFIGVIYFKEMPKVRFLLEWKILRKILLLAVLYGFAAIAFFAALQTSGNSSQVVSINLVNVVVTVLLAVVFLKERENLSKKLAGAFLSLCGLLLLV